MLNAAFPILQWLCSFYDPQHGCIGSCNGCWTYNVMTSFFFFFFLACGSEELQVKLKHGSKTIFGGLDGGKEIINPSMLCLRDKQTFCRGFFFSSTAREYSTRKCMCSHQREWYEHWSTGFPPGIVQNECISTLMWKCFIYRMLGQETETLVEMG